MKKLINPFKGFVLLAFALAPLLSMANNGDEVEKKRSITKTYNVGPDDRLSIENSFGNVTVTTWDKNEIMIDIEIGVHASSEEKAQKMMELINIKDNQGGHEISYKTEIGHMSGKDNWNKNGDDTRKFYIDYKIIMPSKNPLRIENSFGKTIIPDFEGSASITSKFGELSTGKLPNATLVHVEFGKADIGRLNNADVVLKFNGNSNIAGISGNSKVDVQFCSKVNIAVENALSSFSLFQSYSTINLRVSNNLSAQFDVYTNFGSFNNRTEFNINEDKDDESSGPKFDKTYNGKAGSGGAKIKIKSSFGTVRLVDIGDKSVDKEKNDDDDDKDADKTKVNL
jgi:hypothetical protein